MSGSLPSAVEPIPDLLFVEPTLRVDVKQLEQALTFAFGAGGAQQGFVQALHQSWPDSPPWQASCFRDDLFLADLAERCLQLKGSACAGRGAPDRNAHYLVQALASPPGDMAGVRFRQQVLREMCDAPRWHEQARQTHQDIGRLRELLESIGMGRRTGSTRRRLSILQAIADLFNQLLNYQEANSGLRRLGQWAQKIVDSPGHRHLSALLDYEGRLATVELGIRVAREGDIRGFEILRVRENANNPLYTTPLRRFWIRLRCLLRGYRIREGEVVNRLIDSVFDAFQSAVVVLFQVRADLELYLGALALRDRAQARGLRMCLPELSDSGSGRMLQGLFNPFLLLADAPAVPCDLSIPPGGSVVIITGPNSGGKTRLIQALGLTQVLAHAGLFVPCAKAQLPWARGMFASLLRNDSVEQQEGRLGTELLRIRRMFEKLEVSGMVVVDELCSGTNPSEGEELFEMVVSLLAELAPQAFITTHFLQCAARLSQRRPVTGLEFLQVQLDQNELPTFQFIPGVATTSLAQRTAQRLGVTRGELQQLVQAARQRYPGTDNDENQGREGG